MAAERRLGIKGVKGGAFSAAQSSVAPGAGNMTDADRWVLEQGPPLHRNVSLVGGHTHEQFVYDGGIYVYFVDGKFSGGQYEQKETGR